MGEAGSGSRGIGREREDEGKRWRHAGLTSTGGPAMRVSAREEAWMEGIQATAERWTTPRGHGTLATVPSRVGEGRRSAARPWNRSGDGRET